MNWRLFFGAALAAFLVDQMSKLVVVHGLNLKQIGQIDVLPPYLTFSMGWNYGVNFGLFGGGAATRWVLIAVALAICIWVIWWMRRDPGGRMAQISGGILIGGALGNVLDRVIYGAVADFLNMSCCGLNNPYAFNLADVAVFAGIAGLLVFHGRKNPA